MLVLSQAQLLLLGGTLYLTTTATNQSAADHLLDSAALDVLSHFQEADCSSTTLPLTIMQELNRLHSRRLRIIGADGKLIAESPGVAALIAARPGNAPPLTIAQYVTAPEGSHFRMRLFNVPCRIAASAGISSVLVAADVTSRYRALVAYRNFLILLTLALMVGGTAGAWVIASRELKPLQRISDATAAIDFSSLSYRLPPEHWPGELETLSRQINGMLSRLQHSYERLQHYADDIAHEFRNPVNRMLLASEITLSRPRSIEEYREALAANTEECKRLGRLVDSLLFLARAENTMLSPQRVRTDINAELSRLAEYFRNAAEERGISITCSTPERIEADVDRVLFERAVSNLITNAIRHTSRGGTVTLSGETSVDRVVVKVIDTGEGVPPEARSRIFDRFYRSHRISQGDTPGVGLGLSITKQIVEMHGGSIYLESQFGHGTSVSLYFPAPPIGDPPHNDY